MASIFGHFIAGYSIAKLYNQKTKIVFLAMFSSFLPDIDVISFSLGIPYEHMLGHRGLTHSIFFAIIWALLMSSFFKQKIKTVFLIIFLATLSHPIFDAMTTGGLGVAFFAPFTSKRYFFPWRPIKVSPIGIAKFFSKWGWMVIKSEIVYILIPFVILLGAKKLFVKQG